MEEEMVELQKILDEIHEENRELQASAILKNFENINKGLITQDEEMAKLRDDTMLMCTHWKLKFVELGSQVEEHERVAQELKKRLLKLKFEMEESGKALEELRDQLSTEQQERGRRGTVKQKFWETSGSKMLISMSMLILMVFAK